MRKPQPQYQGSWPALSRRVRAGQPTCAWCTTDVDLVADHIVPGKPEFGVRTLCRGCNARRRNGATGPATPTSRGKARPDLTTKNMP